MNLVIIMSIVILIIAISMSMVGKGGGNFYVLAMVLAGVSMQNAATTSQLIMMGTAITSMLVFNKHNKVDWMLALVIDPPTDIMAFVGGYFAGEIEGTTLKLMFAVLLIVISIFMFIPFKEKAIEQKKNLVIGIELLNRINIQLIYGLLYRSPLLSVFLQEQLESQVGHLKFH